MQINIPHSGFFGVNKKMGVLLKFSQTYVQTNLA